MDNQQQATHFWDTSMIKAFIIGVLVNILSWAFHNINAVLSGVLTFLSICYLIWKWRREYLKDKHLSK